MQGLYLSSVTTWGGGRASRFDTPLSVCPVASGASGVSPLSLRTSVSSRLFSLLSPSTSFCSRERSAFNWLKITHGWQGVSHKL